MHVSQHVYRKRPFLYMSGGTCIPNRRFQTKPIFRMKAFFKTDHPCARALLWHKLGSDAYGASAGSYQKKSSLARCITEDGGLGGSLGFGQAQLAGDQAWEQGVAEGGEGLGLLTICSDCVQ